MVFFIWNSHPTKTIQTMKPLSTLLASAAFAFLSSCGSSRQGTPSQPPVTPPSGGNVVDFGSHTAHVYAHSVHFLSVAPTTFRPSEVRVYDFDKDPAGVYDCLWMKWLPNDPWTYYQNVTLLAGVKAESNTTKAKDAMTWFGNAATARARAGKAPQAKASAPAETAPPAAKKKGRWWYMESKKSAPPKAQPVAQVPKASKPASVKKPVMAAKPKAKSTQTRTVVTRGKQPAGKQTAKVSKQKAKSVPTAKESQDEKAKQENLSRLLDHKTEENQADIAASRGEPAPQIPVIDIEVEND